jgi:hypothetical protein
MKTLGQKIADDIRASAGEFITYGEGDLGMPIAKKDAIADFEGMDDEVIGDGAWYDCDKFGNIID